LFINSVSIIDPTTGQLQSSKEYFDVGEWEELKKAMDEDGVDSTADDNESANESSSGDEDMNKERYQKNGNLVDRLF
jgi:hypothetical protein